MPYLEGFSFCKTFVIVLQTSYICLTLMKNTGTVTVRLPKKIKELLEGEAKQRDCSVSYLVRTLIEGSIHEVHAGDTPIFDKIQKIFEVVSKQDCERHAYKWDQVNRVHVCENCGNHRK